MMSPDLFSKAKSPDIVADSDLRLEQIAGSDRTNGNTWCKGTATNPSKSVKAL
jgi:hypothetical protein